MTAAALLAALLGQGAQAGTNSTYAYDALGRLVSVTETDGSSITYTYDAAGNRTAHVTNNGANHPPIAAPDSVATTADSGISFDPQSNDVDPDVDDLVVSSVTQPAHGVVTIAVDGSSITYTPGLGVTSSESFTYTVSDGKGGTASAPVTVAITGSPTNHPPSAGNDSWTTTASTPVTFNPRTNDADSDGDPLSITAVSTAAHGTVSFTSGSVTYTPTAGYTGSDSFTYTLSDGRGGTAVGTVSMTVSIGNQPPVAVNDSKHTALNTVLTFDPRTNDSDPNGDPLSVSAVTQPAHGTAGFSAGSVTYTPASGYNGTDSFNYTVSDGHGGTAAATVSVSVGNRAPVAVNDFLDAGSGTAGSKTVTIVVAGNDSDPDGDSLTVTSRTPPTNGATATINANGSITVKVYDGGTTFSYTISDGHGGVATATVTVDYSSLL